MQAHDHERTGADELFRATLHVHYRRLLGNFRSRMLDDVALAVVFAVVALAVPSMAADLVGGTVGLALAQAFDAAYAAPTIASIVTLITARASREFLKASRVSRTAKATPA